MDKLEDIERLLSEKEDSKKDTVSEKNNKHKKEDKVVNKIPESYLTPGYQKTVQEVLRNFILMSWYLNTNMMAMHVVIFVHIE